MAFLRGRLFPCVLACRDPSLPVPCTELSPVRLTPPPPPPFVPKRSTVEPKPKSVEKVGGKRAASRRLDETATAVVTRTTVVVVSRATTGEQQRRKEYAARDLPCLSKEGRVFFSRLLRRLGRERALAGRGDRRGNQSSKAPRLVST